MTADFIKIVGEILNIHPEPISEETATVELNMGELFKIATEFASQKDASNDKANLGMATTSELIYELAARCDTGSIDKGGNYKTVDND